MLLELRDTLAQAPERQPMRGQRERRRGQLRVAGKRVEEKRERIALGLVRPDTDVGRDLGEHHVAGNENSELLAVKRGMLQRVAVAHDDAPQAAADAMLLS